MSATHESPATHLRLRGVTLALLLGALLVAACSGSTDRPEAEVDPDRLTEQINGYLDSIASFDAVRVVLVQSDGEAVVDLYRGADPEDYWDVASVTKSVISILVGIAVDQGHIAGTDQTLAQLLPSYAAQMAPQVAEVTLHQLLTMTAGFSGVFDRSGFIDRTSQEMRAADPVGRILRTASANRAGEFDYSNGGAHLVSSILVEATGLSVLDYARSSLFEPLGISSEPAHEPVGGGLRVDEPTDPVVGVSAGYARAYLEAGFAWPVDSAGNHMGWSFLKLTPADLAKLGVLMADQGRWNGEQVVSEEWVRTSTTAQVENAGEEPPLAGYGYLWWKATADGEPAFVASGYGGQLIEVVPTKDLVVAVASEYDLTKPSFQDLNGTELVQLVDDVIAPAFPTAR